MLDEAFIQRLGAYVLAQGATQEASTRGAAMSKPSHWPAYAGIGPVVCCDAARGVREYVDAERLSPFSTELLALIDERGLADVDVYRRAGLDRRHFSKLRSTGYHPSKPTAIALCLALGLTTGDAERLLSSAGYALGRSEVFDLVIRYCIDHDVHDLMDVNEALSSMGADPLPVRSRA